MKPNIFTPQSTCFDNYFFFFFKLDPELDQVIFKFTLLISCWTFKVLGRAVLHDCGISWVASFFSSLTKCLYQDKFIVCQIKKCLNVN